MAQSREAPITLTALTLNQQLVEKLSKISSTFNAAFEAAGYNDTFNHFWEMVSPSNFPCDDLQHINKYYSNHSSRILITLEAEGLHDLPMDKKVILKAVSDLCHSLARIKYIIDKLTKTLPKPEHVFTACNEIQAQLNPTEMVRTWSNHSVNQEILQLAGYSNAISHHLIMLGYLKIENDSEDQRMSHYRLPEALKPDLERLKNNKALNELLEPIEAAKKAGRDAGTVSKPLNDEMITMTHMQHQLAQHNQAAIQRLEAILSEMNDEKHRLEAVLSCVEGNAYVFQLCPILNEYEDERTCPNLNTAIRNLEGFCDKLISYFRSNPPWVEAKSTVSSLSTLNTNLELFINSYTSMGINIIQLRLQYEQLKSQHRSLCMISAELSARIIQAKEASQRHQQAISNTIGLLQDHLRPVKSDSVFGFIRRHWDIMAAGGAIGGGAAVAAVLISTNPILLTVCIGSGIVLGTVGGSGGGLLHDAINEKKQNKNHTNPAVTSSAKSYGSFWRTDSAAAAAAAATTAVVTEPSTTMALRQ